MLLKFIFIAALYTLYLNGSSQDTFGLIDTKLDTAYDANSNIIGIGYTIKDGNYKDLKYGAWTEYYPTGEKKGEGLFLTEKYMECNDGSVFWKYYSYKVGQWKYYFKNKFIKAEGTYETQIFNYSTACKGGYNIIKQKVGKNWVFYLENEKITKPEKNYLKELEEISFIVG